MTWPVCGNSKITRHITIYTVQFLNQCLGVIGHCHVHICEWKSRVTVNLWTQKGSPIMISKSDNLVVALAVILMSQSTASSRSIPDSLRSIMALVNLSSKAQYILSSTRWLWLTWNMEFPISVQIFAKLLCVFWDKGVPSSASVDCDWRKLQIHEKTMRNIVN